MSTISKSSRAWLVFVLCSFFVFYKYVLEVSPNVIGKHMMAYYQITANQLGWLSQLYFLAYMIMQLPLGVVLDRFGPKRVMSLCLLACAVGAWLQASADHYFVAQLARFITGLGAAVAVLGSLKFLTLCFDTRRLAFMTGSLMTVGMLGAASGNTVVQYCLGFYHWHKLYYYLSIFGFGLSLVFVLAVRNRRSADSDASSLGLKESLMIIMRNRQSWVLSVYSGLLCSSLFIVGAVWGAQFFQRVFDFSDVESALVVSMPFLGFAVGAPFWGWYSDMTKMRMPPLYVSTIISLFIGLYMVMAATMSYLVALTLMLLFGFFVSAFVLSFSMIRERNPLRYAGTAMGFMNTFNALAIAVIDHWVSSVLSYYHFSVLATGERLYPAVAYRSAFMLLPAVLLVGLLLLFFIKETHAKQNYLYE